MLSFKEFQEYAEMNLKDALPPEYENAKVTLNTVTKNNGMVLTALTVLPDGQNVAPNIYLDGFYAEYKAGSDLSTIMDEIADMCVAHIDVPQQFATIGNDFKNFDYIKDRVIMVAVSRERNAELLTQVPHHNKEDLALIYKVLIDQGAEGIGTITIRNEHMAFWDVTADDIKSLAEKNSVELLPAKVQSMDEVMREMFAKDGMDDEMMEAMFAERPIEEQMFVISNESRVNGAAAMFYEGVLSKLAERMGSDLYILPSSVHECIAVSSNMGTPEGLAEMVSEINEGQVSPEERLSDHVYRYSAEKQTLTLADTTVEALGLVAAENSQTYEATKTNTEGSVPRHHR